MGVTARWRLRVAYRGTEFHGFAAQPSVRTVAGELAAALKNLARLESAPIIVCAGRTDAGVHAVGQVVHVDLPDPLPEGNAGPVTATQLCRSLNRQLGRSISVIDAARVSNRFDARHSATWRRYRYLIHEGSAPDPLLADLAWNVAGPLDVRAMAQAIGAVMGSHDFRAFCRKAPGTTSAEPIVRVVTDASVSIPEEAGVIDLVDGRLIRIELQASSFCHQMVRSIVGQLVDIGRGRSTAADLVGLLKSHDRQDAAQPAPPEGLCLIAVGYDEEPGTEAPAVEPGLPEAPDSP